MATIMKVNGRMTKKKGLEELLKAMATIMKVNGRMTKKKVLENIFLMKLLLEDIIFGEFILIFILLYTMKDAGKKIRKKVFLDLKLLMEI